jgi:hypothetical protein
MCCNYSILNQTKNGMLVLLKGCGNYQLTFNNLNFSLTPFELEHFTKYLTSIDCSFWETEYEHSIYDRKIPIPTLQTNLMLLLNRFEVQELLLLVNLKKTEKFLHSDEINYRLNWN